MIKWVKFFTSDGLLQDVFTENGFVTEAHTNHNFASAEEAVSKSTEEAFIVWDGKPISKGVAEEPTVE